ncbi:DDE-type integrase/transposase/recombinase [Sneathiella chungangensis]|uniref:DDE-type integrase/transposase/recombinase n=2 Tax=Sneathiella chungangensis TaxID=1418234 RepID=A0A845MH17_9PROT|nr:DDE-type integrase/transposase/recombinase [Sneathiella chungangensis]
MVVVIRGRRYFLWHVVDAEGEVLDVLVQPSRNAKVALKLIRKLLKKQGCSPPQIVIANLRSYHRALAIRTSASIAA